MANLQTSAGQHGGETTDEVLALSAADGNRPAFNVLIGRYERRLLGFLLQRTPCHADAEDALQQAFVKAYLNLSKYRPRYRFSTWLFTIARRELCNLQRCKNATVALESAHLIECVPTSASTSLWPLARQLLNPDQFAALWLHYAEDLPVKDVAEVLGRTRIWVKVNLLRARRTLREHCLAVSPPPTEPQAQIASGVGKALLGGEL